jgi:membrane protease YdiL (CAAX protease family)
VAFGVIVPQSIAALLDPQRLYARTAPPITNAALLGSVIYELVVLGFLGAFLATRGWTLARLGLKPTWRESAAGVGLAAAFYFCVILLWMVTMALWPRIGAFGAATHLVRADLQLPTVLLACVVNPVFEELFLCGYVISALRESRGVTTAINVSAAIRVFCHFYQGVVGVITIVPMALLFAYVYARSGRLWPLIVAHAIVDLAGLMPYLS